MEKKDLIKGLQEIVGENRVITDEDIIKDSAKDYIGFRRYERADGVYNVPRAACVVKPQNKDQVSQVLKYLNEKKIDVAPRTGGSSVTMSIEPISGGVILDGSDMNEIIEFSEKDMLITVGCGTPLEYIEQYLNKKGYTTGHYPQSLPMADIGGLIATRSTGQFSTLYGGIEEVILGLEAVLPDGEIIKIKNVPRRSVGPDLRQIFVGSEGIFGFITEATLKISKFMPEDRWMNAYAVKGMNHGLELIREIMVDGYRPAVVRLHDEVEVAVHFGGIAPEGYALLLLLADGPKPLNEATGAYISELVKKYDTIDLGKKPVESWLIHRNDVCEDMDKPIYYNRGIIADTCEIAALWSEIGDIYYAVLERAQREIPGLAMVGGHSSHNYVQGTNIYFQFAMQPTDGSNKAEEDYMQMVGIIMEETLKRGGSIAHHHGSGKYRTKWMPQEHGSSYVLLRKLKETLDPNGIMNKGVLITEN